MKAIIAYKPNDVRLEDVPTPEIKNSTDVRIKVRSVGVCGSDMHTVHGTNPFVIYPRVLGHEIAGEVEMAGDDVDALKIGDKVVLEPTVPCSKCYACTHGHPNVCKTLKAYGVHMDGGFSEYFVADQANFHKVPDSLTFEQASMIEPYSIGAQCCWRGDVQKDDIVLVHGAGPIGLIIMDTAKSLGAKVIISEINEYRLEFAKQLGTDYIINPEKQNIRERLMELTDGMGPNVIFEAAGTPSLLPLSLEVVSEAGRIVALGFGRQMVPTDFSIAVKKELTILGTRNQSYKFKPVIENFTKHLPTVNRLITNVYPAKEFMSAFEAFTDKNSRACKVVLAF